MNILPRDARLSVRHVRVSRRLKRSSNFFHGPVASSFIRSSILTSSTDTQCKGTSSSGALNTRGWENWDFRLKSAFISDAVRDAHGCYEMLIGSHGWRIDPCRFRWLWVTLKGGTRRVNFFRPIYLITLVYVWPRTIKFGKFDQIGEGRVCIGVHHAPTARGLGPGAPQFLVFPSISAYTLWHRTTKFDVATLVGRGLFSGGHPCLHPKGAGSMQHSQILGVPFYLCVHYLTQTYQIKWKGLVFRGSSTAPRPN